MKEGRKENYGATPAVLGVNLCALIKQQLDHMGKALASGYMQSCAAIDISKINIRPWLQHLLNPFQISLIR